MGAAAGVGAVGVGFSEVGGETRQQLDEVGGVEEGVGARLYLDGFVFSEFFSYKPHSILLPGKNLYHNLTGLTKPSKFQYQTKVIEHVLWYTKNTTF